MLISCLIVVSVFFCYMSLHSFYLYDNLDRCHYILLHSTILKNGFLLQLSISGGNPGYEKRLILSLWCTIVYETDIRKLSRRRNRYHPAVPNNTNLTKCGGWTRVLRNGTTVHCHYWLPLLWWPLNVRSDEFSLTTKNSCFNSVLVSSGHLSSKSCQLIDIYSVCMCCWNVAAYKWKVHNGKINIISFVVKFRCRNYSIQLNAIFW